MTPPSWPGPFGGTAAPGPGSPTDPYGAPPNAGYPPATGYPASTGYPAAAGYPYPGAPYPGAPYPGSGDPGSPYPGGPIEAPTYGKPSARWMAFDPTKRPPRWGMPDILLGLIVWFAASVVFVIGAEIAVPDNKGLVNIIALFGGWVGMVGYVFFCSKVKGQGTLRDDFGFRFRWFDPFLGFAVGFGTLIVAGIASQVVANLFSAPQGNNRDEIFVDQTNKPIVVITALMAAIGAPIVEELFFRGLTLRAVERRLGAVAGVIGSAVLFAMLHWQPGELGSTASLVTGILTYGLVFAVVTRWQGRIGPSICAHMTINGIASGVLLYEIFTGNKLGV